MVPAGATTMVFGCGVCSTQGANCAVVAGTRIVFYGTCRSPGLDICRALSYLHEEMSVCVVHRDIKLKNVLVFGDKLEDSTCKIGDFGLATSMVDQNSVEVLRI